jgi:predicted nucleic acid-binding protein
MIILDTNVVSEPLKPLPEPKVLQQALNAQVMQLFDGRILAFDLQAAQVFAQINARSQAAGNPISFADCAIASITSALTGARVHACDTQCA